MDIVLFRKDFANAGFFMDVNAKQAVYNPIKAFQKAN